MEDERKRQYLDEELWQQFIEKAKEKFSENEINKLEEVYLFAKKAHEGQYRASNEPYILHPINVALIILSFNTDLETISAALLHDVVEDTNVTLETIKDKFGKEVASLVDGVSKISQIKFLSFEEWKLESLRKVLIAMASDFRVVLIKLADRLHNMKTLNYLPEEKRKAIAKETMEIYVPLAHRLGIYTLKWELEDLAFKYLEPEIFQDLKIKVAKKRSEREKEIEEIKRSIELILSENKITCRVEGRAKNLYSIYRKMKKENKTFDEIYDLTALRVIVSTISDCYKTLGLVHTRWKPIPGRIKDYIAIPKPNGYQSLHTTLIGDNGEPFEIQIRTEEMHRNCEYGIASHWLYKEDKKIDPDLSKKINWIRQIIEWQKTIPSAKEFINRVKEDIFSDEIFVFTPKGEIINLPQDATPIDFAYKIHTEIGNKCIGAKVNGKIVPLNYKLKTGDRVEILTSKTSPGPSRDWLKFVKSSSTKEKIRQFFRRKEKEEEKKEVTEREEIEKKEKGVVLERKIKVSNNFGIILPEIKGDILVTLAKCCTPIPGDEIIGYVSKTRGVVVHRRDCKNLLSTISKIKDNTNKLVNVQWAGEVKILYPVKINIHVKDEPGVLNRIISIIAKYNYNIESINAPPSKNKEKTTIIYLTLQIPGYGRLKDLIEEIKITKDVLGVERDR